MIFFLLLVSLLLILVSIKKEDRKPLAATAIICSLTAFVFSPVLLPPDPPAPRTLVSCQNGFEGRCSSSPLLSLPLFPGWCTHWAYQEKQKRAGKTWWEGKRAFPLEWCKRKESPSAEKEYGPCWCDISHPLIFSALNSVFRSNQHNLALQCEIPLEKVPALQMRSERTEIHHFLQTHSLWNPCDYSSFFLTSTVTPASSHNPYHWLCHCD